MNDERNRRHIIHVSSCAYTQHDDAIESHHREDVVVLRNSESSIKVFVALPLRSCTDNSAVPLRRRQHDGS